MNILGVRNYYIYVCIARQRNVVEKPSQESHHKVEGMYVCMYVCMYVYDE